MRLNMELDPQVPAPRSLAMKSQGLAVVHPGRDLDSQLAVIDLQVNGSAVSRDLKRNRDLGLYFARSFPGTASFAARLTSAKFIRPGAERPTAAKELAKQVGSFAWVHLLE